MQDITNDIINLDLIDVPTINLNGSSTNSVSSGRPSVNFGGGIELLMNDKRLNDGKGKKENIDIGLGDLNDLENELNDLVDTMFDNIFIWKKSFNNILKNKKI